MSESNVGDSAHGPSQSHGSLSFLSKYVFSQDHKVIGIQFFFSSLFFFAGLQRSLRLLTFVRVFLNWSFSVTLRCLNFCLSSL